MVARSNAAWLADDVTLDILPLEQRAAGAVGVERIEVRGGPARQPRAIGRAQAGASDEFGHLEREGPLQVEQAVARPLGREPRDNRAVRDAPGAG